MRKFSCKISVILARKSVINPLTLFFILPNRLPKWPKFGGLSAVSPHIRESKTILDSAFHAMNSRFHLLDSWIFVNGTWIPDFRSCIPDFKVQKSGFHNQNYSNFGFQGPNTLWIQQSEFRNIERSVAQRESMSLLQAFRPVPLSYCLNWLFRFNLSYAS